MEEYHDFNHFDTNQAGTPVMEIVPYIDLQTVRVGAAPHFKSLIEGSSSRQRKEYLRVRKDVN